MTNSSLCRSCVASTVSCSTARIPGLLPLLPRLATSSADSIGSWPSRYGAGWHSRRRRWWLFSRSRMEALIGDLGRQVGSALGGVPGLSAVNELVGSLRVAIGVGGDQSTTWAGITVVSYVGLLELIVAIILVTILPTFLPLARPEDLHESAEPISGWRGTQSGRLACPPSSRGLKVCSEVVRFSSCSFPTIPS